eukprot:720525-Pleurochrysis_carterae.AAC.1
MPFSSDIALTSNIQLRLRKAKQSRPCISKQYMLVRASTAALDATGRRGSNACLSVRMSVEGLAAYQNHIRRISVLMMLTVRLTTNVRYLHVGHVMQLQLGSCMEMALHPPLMG